MTQQTYSTLNHNVNNPNQILYCYFRLLYFFASQFQQVNCESNSLTSDNNQGNKAREHFPKETLRHSSIRIRSVTHNTCDVLRRSVQITVKYGRVADFGIQIPNIILLLTVRHEHVGVLFLSKINIAPRYSIRWSVKRGKTSSFRQFY